MEHIEIKIGGFGGQGIILAGHIIGKAASIFDVKNATLTQSYGPESRGGACNAQIIISDEEVDYPMVQHPDILIIMSKEAYDKYIPALKDTSILLYDEDLVENRSVSKKSIRQYSIPATRIAEELGKKIIANIVMLGFFTAITRVIPQKAMEEAVKTSVPKGTEELNLKAFLNGFAYGEEKLKLKTDATH